MHVIAFRLRVPAFFAVLATILFVAAACGAPPPLPNSPETPATTEATENKGLVLWHTFEGQRRDTLEELAGEFHEVYPELELELVYVGGRDDLTKQMTAAIALGTIPDLVLADRRQIAEFAEQGGLQALEKFMDDEELGLKAEDRRDFLHGLLNLGKYPSLDDRTYGIPFNQEALVLFYNADLLGSINLNRAPQTWDQFGEYSSLVTGESNYGWAMRADAATLEAMLASRGSALLTDAEERALFNERAGMNSFRLVAALTEAGAAKLASSDDKARTEFGSGKAAFYMGWMSELDAIETAQRSSKSRFEIGIAPLPQLDASLPWLLVRGELFALPKVSPERSRNAWFFVRWMTEPTQSARWVRATDALPLRASALTFLAPDLATNARFRQIAGAFDGVLPRLAPQPAHPHMDTADAAVSGLWLEAVQPKADLRVILDDMATRVNQLLAIQP